MKGGRVDRARRGVKSLACAVDSMFLGRIFGVCHPPQANVSILFLEDVKICGGALHGDEEEVHWQDHSQETFIDKGF